MGIAWEVVVAAEMISGGGSQIGGTSGGGLGFFIWNSYVGGSYEQIVVGMISIGIARQQGGRRFGRCLFEAHGQDLTGMNWVLSRETMIAMALLGAAASVLATLPPIGSAGFSRRLNSAGYVLMGASMLVFIIDGLRSGIAQWLNSTAAARR